MDKFQLLALKKAVTVYEAAQLLTRGNGGASAAEALIVEAIELGELAANVIRGERDPFDFGRSQPGIFSMMTTVQRADLDSWLSSKGLSIVAPPAVLTSPPAAALPVSTPQAAPAIEVGAPVVAAPGEAPIPPAPAIWPAARKLELLDEHECLKQARHPSPTAELAKKYNVSVTCIRSRLTEARELKRAATPVAQPATPWDPLRTK